MKKSSKKSIKSHTTKSILPSAAEMTVIERPTNQQAQKYIPGLTAVLRRHAPLRYVILVVDYTFLPEEWFIRKAITNYISLLLPGFPHVRIDLYSYGKTPILLDVCSNKRDATLYSQVITAGKVNNAVTALREAWTSNSTAWFDGKDAL
jgi:hypothetical protein